MCITINVELLFKEQKNEVSIAKCKLISAFSFSGPGKPVNEDHCLDSGVTKNIKILFFLVGGGGGGAFYNA